jgi:YVTN family beta-propeller protein
MRHTFTLLYGGLLRARGARIMAAALLLLTGLTLGGASSPSAAATGAPKAYIGLYGASAVDVLDTATGHVLRTIKVPAGPEAVIVPPNGQRVYVSSEDATQLSVIDTTTDRVIKTLDLGRSPRGWPYRAMQRRCWWRSSTLASWT